MKEICVWAIDEQVTSAFRQMLEAHSHVVQVAQTMEQVQSITFSMRPDLVLIDLDGLPNASVYYDWSRALPEHLAHRRLFVSGHEEDADFVNHLLSSGEAVLNKPLNRKAFQSMLNSLLYPIQAAPDALSNFLYMSQQNRSLSPPELESALVEGHAIDRVAGRRVGSVVLEAEVGRGGMGIVFKGSQPSLHREVAVKMILPHLGTQEDMLIRLQREALATANLKSPHIVGVFDAGYTSEQIFYIVMEWLSGCDLEKKLFREGAMSPVDALRLVRQIALGLETAHRAGIIHRDIKPSNIIINDEGKGIITDFGLSHQAHDERLTNEGVVLGTADYLSPEQIKGEALDGRTDIYSLGIVLYELLAGVTPFQGDDLTDVMYRHLNEPLPDVR